MKKFRLLTLLGIRPDYIRMYKVIKLLDEQTKFVDHIFVHSGQHYDPELFGNFIKGLEIRKPDFDLGIGLTLKKRGVSNHAYQVALLSEKVFDLVEKVKPDAVMYLGDTNTVLSSITVARCGVPVIHLEAGGRSFDWRMPEEKNRVTIDHISDALYSYLPHYKDILVSEGIEPFRVKVIGNIIVDPIKDFAKRIDDSLVLKSLGVKNKSFILVTVHREENISNKEILTNKLRDIFRFARENKLPVVFPLMPRTAVAVEKFKLSNILTDEIFIKTKPFGFFDFSKLERTARLVVSDSGTVQEETLIVGTPCVITRRSTERPETIAVGATILEGQEGKHALYDKMCEAYVMKTNWDQNVLNPEGGSPSERVVADLITKVKDNYFVKSRSYDFLKHNLFVRQAYGKN